MSSPAKQGNQQIFTAPRSPRCRALFVVLCLHLFLLACINKASRSEVMSTAPAPPPSAKVQDAPAHAGTGEERQQRAVFVNRTRLGDEEVAALERQYRTKIRDGRYWYDPRCGAWGVEGGPGVGLLPAGLRLGGPLRADASNGNTGVFVNGRELHALDVAALRQFGPVYKGRYWLDARGNVGYEGGPAILNLVQLINAARSRGAAGRGRRSVLSTWDRTGVAVFGY